MIVRLRELRSNEAICRYDNIKKKEDDPMSSLKDNSNDGTRCRRSPDL